MKKIKKATSWIQDYFYAIWKHFFVYKPIDKYLLRIKKNKNPIILIPGLFEEHHFLDTFADALSLAGHPIYILENLGRNIKTVPDSAKLVKELIIEKDLHNIIIVAHSKGGLIGKYLLAFDNADDRIKKVIAIASPWKGTKLFNYFWQKSMKEFRPESEIINKLKKQPQVNNKIVSIYGESDNVVFPIDSCYLEGAKNIQVKNHGHHKILFDEHVCDIVMSEVEK